MSTNVAARRAIDLIVGLIDQDEEPSLAQLEYLEQLLFGVSTVDLEAEMAAISLVNPSIKARQCKADIGGAVVKLRARLAAQRSGIESQRQEKLTLLALLNKALVQRQALTPQEVRQLATVLIGLQGD